MFTSATREVRGKGVPTRTPMACFGSTPQENGLVGILASGSE